MRTILLTALVSAALLIALGFALPAGADDRFKNDPAASLSESARIVCERKGLKADTPEFKACYNEEVSRIAIERANRIGASGAAGN